MFADKFFRIVVLAFLFLPVIGYATTEENHGDQNQIGDLNLDTKQEPLSEWKAYREKMIARNLERQRFYESLYLMMPPRRLCKLQEDEIRFEISWCKSYLELLTENNSDGDHRVREYCNHWTQYSAVERIAMIRKQCSNSLGRK